MINAEKIVFEKQNYYTPSWSGVTTVKILEVLPKGKVRVKAGESIFVRSIPEGALRTLFLRTMRLPRGRCFLFYKGLRTFGHLYFLS